MSFPGRAISELSVKQQIKDRKATPGPDSREEESL